MKLQLLRKKLSLSQSDLSRISGVNLRTIQEYEVGRRLIDGARVDTLVNLSDALGVPFYEILESKALSDKVKRNIAKIK